MAQHGPHVTLALTLPITCHICLGKVTAPPPLPRRWVREGRSRSGPARSPASAGCSPWGMPLCAGRKAEAWGRGRGRECLFGAVEVPVSALGSRGSRLSGRAFNPCGPAVRPPGRLSGQLERRRCLKLPCSETWVCGSQGDGVQVLVWFVGFFLPASIGPSLRQCVGLCWSWGCVAEMV